MISVLILIRSSPVNLQVKAYHKALVAEMYSSELKGMMLLLLSQMAVLSLSLRMGLIIHR